LLLELLYLFSKKRSAEQFVFIKQSKHNTDALRITLNLTGTWTLK